MSSLPDSNVWLALAYSDHVHHSAALRWFESNDKKFHQFVFCRITQMALLRHLTNERIMGKDVQSQTQAWFQYDQLLHDPRICFAEEVQQIDVVFRELTGSSMSSHRLWTDAYLAAFAISHGLQLVTFDSGFNQFSALAPLILTNSFLA